MDVMSKLCKKLKHCVSYILKLWTFYLDLVHTITKTNFTHVIANICVSLVVQRRLTIRRELQEGQSSTFAFV